MTDHAVKRVMQRFGVKDKQQAFNILYAIQRTIQKEKPEPLAVSYKSTGAMIRYYNFDICGIPARILFNNAKAKIITVYPEDGSTFTHETT